MNNRRDLLILALRSLRDVSETLQRGDSGGQFVPGPRMLMMPNAWHAGCPRDCIYNGTCKSTYAILLRQLVTLKKLGPAHYWNLSERYIRSERLNRDLVYTANGSYFELMRKAVSASEMIFYPGERLRANEEVLRAIVIPKATVRRKRPTDPVPKLARAVVERWDALVVPRMVERGLDALLFLMPREMPLPSDVMKMYAPSKPTVATAAA